MRGLLSTLAYHLVVPHDTEIIQQLTYGWHAMHTENRISSATIFESWNMLSMLGTIIGARCWRRTAPLYWQQWFIYSSMERCKQIVMVLIPIGYHNYRSSADLMVSTWWTLLDVYSNVCNQPYWNKSSFRNIARVAERNSVYDISLALVNLVRYYYVGLKLDSGHSEYEKKLEKILVFTVSV